MKVVYLVFRALHHVLALYFLDGLDHEDPYFSAALAVLYLCFRTQMNPLQLLLHLWKFRSLIIGVGHDVVHLSPAPVLTHLW